MTAAVDSMPRYVAFLRGVSPTNAKMPELVRCFTEAGFAEVKTVLGSGNVIFTVHAATARATLEARAERATADGLGRRFPTIVRSQKELGALLSSDPFAGLAVPNDAKRVITFLRQPPTRPPRLPIEQDGAAILKLAGTEVFTAYVPSPKGPVFMTLLERTFGQDITTRTLATVEKCARA